MGARPGERLHNSTLTQPGIGAVFLRGNLIRLLDCGAVQLPIMTTRRQLRRESTGKILGEIDTLNAALLQQAGARPALGCAGNLLAIHENVRANRIRETHVLIVAALYERRIYLAPAVIDRRYSCKL